jgi:GPH family glycoside/pentoside/hexuronide:cation symporter
LLLPMLWTLPGMETANNPWYSNIPFFYIVVVGSLLAVAYTLYVVPYTALGFEMTPNYDERTRVIVWRMYIGLGGSLAAGWLFRLAAADYFPDLGAGAFWVSVGVAAIVLVAGMIPVFGCKEDLNVEKQAPIKLLPAIKYTMTNKPFVILFFTYIMIIVALFAAQSIAPLLIQHHVFGGDEKQVGTFQGLLMSLAVALSYVSMIAITIISARTSKQIAMRIGLTLVLVGTVVNYFAIDPRWPWAMYLAGGITFLGMQGCWLMIDSMVADVCDDDELRSGRRREGMFSAVKGFALKAAQGITFGLGGYMATFAGYNPEVVGSTGLDDATATRMKLFLIGFQAIGLFISIILISKYPISRKRAEETRRLLDQRTADKGMADIPPSESI